MPSPRAACWPQGSGTFQQAWGAGCVQTSPPLRKAAWVSAALSGTPAFELCLHLPVELYQEIIHLFLLLLHLKDVRNVFPSRPWSSSLFLSLK